MTIIIFLVQILTQIYTMKQNRNGVKCVMMMRGPREDETMVYVAVRDRRRQN